VEEESIGYELETALKGEDRGEEVVKVAESLKGPSDDIATD
jgi:hypothetical protein